MGPTAQPAGHESALLVRLVRRAHLVAIVLPMGPDEGPPEQRNGARSELPAQLADDVLALLGSSRLQDSAPLFVRSGLDQASPYRFRS